MKDYNKFSAWIRLFNSEKDANAEKADNEKKKKELDKADKNSEKETKEQIEKHNELMPGMELDVCKGLDHLLSLKNNHLKEFARYFFKLNIPNLFKKKTAELHDLLRPHFIQCINNLGADALDGAEDAANALDGAEDVRNIFDAPNGIDAPYVDGVDVMV